MNLLQVYEELALNDLSLLPGELMACHYKASEPCSSYTSLRCYITRPSRQLCSKSDRRTDLPKKNYVAKSVFFAVAQLSDAVHNTASQAELTKALPCGKNSARLPLDTMQHQTAAAETKQIKRKKKNKASIKTDDGLHFPKMEKQGMSDAKNTRLHRTTVNS